MEKSWKIETQRLAEALRCVEWERGYIDRRFAEGIEAADDNAEESIRQMLARRHRQLTLVRDNPYFARIDFTEAGKQEEHCYLGKTTITDEERNLQVVDWRAPVASLYYECRLGQASYTSPERDVHGELTLKRQYTIENKELKRFEDIDITSDDELLRPFLTVSADARLKNIISTIQAEQNRIIRAPADTPLIVQGVAGSGKTTVALHRIAYLVYTFQKKFTPEKFMILAPNKFFLNYISHVLPDLGVDEVPQKTFEELARELLRAKLPVEDPALGLERVMEAGLDCPEARSAAYKGSLQCREDLDSFLSEYSAGKPVELYRRFLKQSTVKWKTEDLTPLLYIWHRQRRASAVMNPTALDRRMRQMKHIIIDEAQDYSVFQLALLRELYPCASFTILGDLAQGLYSYRSLTDWAQVNSEVWEGEADIRTLQKSYRTTVEIMDYASGLLTGLPGMLPGEAVVRHGPPVTHFKSGSGAEAARVIAERIGQHQADGHVNIAVIVKSQRESARLSKLLPQAGLPGFMEITGRENAYTGGVSLLTAALSKGLEFDAVILADESQYTQEKADLHLKYVACTRAMHVLDILEAVI